MPSIFATLTWLVNCWWDNPPYFRRLLLAEQLLALEGAFLEECTKLKPMSYFWSQGIARVGTFGPWKLRTLELSWLSSSIQLKHRWCPFEIRDHLLWSELEQVTTSGCKLRVVLFCVRPWCCANTTFFRAYLSIFETNTVRKNRCVCINKWLILLRLTSISNPTIPRVFWDRPSPFSDIARSKRAGFSDRRPFIFSVISPAKYLQGPKDN